MEKGDAFYFQMFEVWATYPLNLNVWIKLTQNLPSSKPFSSEVTVYKMLIEYEKLMAPVNSDFFFKSLFFPPTTRKSTSSITL